MLSMKSLKFFIIRNIQLLPAPYELLNVFKYIWSFVIFTSGDIYLNIFKYIWSFVDIISAMTIFVTRSIALSSHHTSFTRIYIYTFLKSKITAQAYFPLNPGLPGCWVTQLPRFQQYENSRKLK